MLQIVLFEPEIPANTGSIGRTCVATNTPLHLVGKLGFSLEDKYLKRAGLDYWKDVNLQQHDSWSAFEKAHGQTNANQRIILFSKKATKSIYEFKFHENDILVFGKETKGLPDTLLEHTSYPSLRIPTPGPVRSLNLAVSAGVALYEAIRQTRY